jgi:formate dehydrogenase subunit gamma
MENIEMTSTILTRCWRVFGVALVLFGSPFQNAIAQAAAGAAAAPVVAPAPESDAAAKVAPTLPAGSTAARGWNVPPKWSDVEQKPQYASVAGRETNVLIEDQGHWWRAVRNGPVTFFGGIALLVVPLLLLVFYAIKGSMKLHDKPTGRLMERFNSAERTAHWTMAISFLVLAVTGLITLFGKYVLLPVLGASAFSWVVSTGLHIHNFVGPLFMFSIVVSFFIYVKDNFISGADFAWLAKFGGMLSGKEIPSGRFNGGEKVWFWLGVVFLGIVVSASGVVMLFPNWDTARELMAQANLLHATGAIIFACMAFAHIYLGTIGTEGAYQGMRQGQVDETWAKEHHQLWYDEVKSGKRAGKISGAAQPANGDD